MAGKNGLSGYKQNLEVQVLEGLVNGDLGVMQQGRTYPGRVKGVDGNSLCECAINPTHCFRTVSQRQLSVPTRFLSEHKAIPAGDDMFDNLFTSTTGALGDLTPGSGRGVVFNDANVNQERRRIYDMVLIAMRASIDVSIVDAFSPAAGSIDVATLQQNVANFAAEYISFKLYHSADRQDPFVDSTQLAYILRPRGNYLLVPPIKWIDRDPAMELIVDVAEFGGNQGNAPEMINTLRDLEGEASVTIDCLFVPDPEICPDLWPGELCPRDRIANTPYYSGRIQSARRALKALVK